MSFRRSGEWMTHQMGRCRAIAIGGRAEVAGAGGAGTPPRRSALAAMAAMLAALMPGAAASEAATPESSRKRLRCTIERPSRVKSAGRDGRPADPT